MKKLLAIFAILLSLSFAHADDEWRDYVKSTTYAKALESVKGTDKVVMVMLSREGCDACWYMKNVVFKNDDIQEIIDRDFIFVHVDKDLQTIPTGLKYYAGPTFFFLNKDGKKVALKLNAPVDGVLIGAESTKEFLITLEEVVKASKVKEKL
jgi:hypothetical protein